jgi:hypothetical protein
MKDTFNIAVCISGQSRTWRSAKENILNFFNIKEIAEKPGVKINVDYFIHTWDTNSYRDKTQPRWENTDYKVDPSEEDDIKFTFIPAAMEYEKYNPQEHIHAWSGLFYSFMKSIMLKRKYELKHDIVYDMVVKTRFDINFPQEGINKYSLPINKFYPHICRPLTAYASSPTPTKFPTEFYYNSFDDVFFYADSPTMDLIALVYKWYRDITTRGLIKKQAKEFVDDAEYYYGPGTLLYKHLVNWNIHPYADHANPYYVVRKTALDLNLHSINDWKQIHDLHWDWYNNGYGTNESFK